MRHRSGFSLLEVIVVLVIVAILAAAGSLTFASISGTANEREARRRVDRVVLAERTWAARNASWTNDANELLLGRGLTLVSGPSLTTSEVSVSVEDGLHLGLAAIADGGSCQAKYLGDPLTGRVETWVAIPDDQPCSGRSALIYGR